MNSRFANTYLFPKGTETKMARKLNNFEKFDANQNLEKLLLSQGLAYQYKFPTVIRR